MNTPINLTIPQGPTIPGTTNQYANETILMNVSNSVNHLRQFQSNSITNGTATLSNGILSGLDNPINANDAANKQYIDSVYGININTSANSVQYNNNNTFGGSSNLTFEIDNDLNIGTLTVNGTIASGVTYIQNSKLVDIDDPTTNDTPATKEYIDLLDKKYVSTINNINSVIYTAAQVVNGIILRQGLIVPINNDTTLTDISVINTDTFPTAQQMFTRLQQIGIFPSVGLTFTFNITNINNNSSVSLVLVPQNTSVVFFPPNIIITGNSQLSARCVVTNINVPEVYVYFNELSYVGTQSFIIPGLNTPKWSMIYKNPQGPVIKTLRTVNQVILPMNPITYSTSDPVIYTYTDLSSKLIIRSGLTSNVSDTFESSTSFLDNDFFNGYTSGLGMKFAIQNTSDTYSINITPGQGWTLNKAITILPGYTAYLGININKTVNSITVYTIGLLSRY